jgi:serine/threonine protein kinase
MDEIGGYLLRRRMSEMPNGELFEAESKGSGGRAIVELLRSDLGRAERARESLGELVERLTALDHPNLARCIERVEAEGKLGLAFEAPHGPSLRTLLVATGRLPWDAAAPVVARVARGLAEAHGRVPALLHLDLRPERVLLGAGGAVRVQGLGLMALCEVLGKGAPRSLEMLRHMSPEQIDGTSVDARADLYGLGLLFYELLAGHPPFQSSSMRTLMNMQCSEGPVPLADHVRAALPQGIHTLLLQLLEKEAGKRPQTARELFERLEAFLPGGADDALARVIAAAEAGSSRGAEPCPRPEARREVAGPTAPQSAEPPRSEASREPTPSPAASPDAARLSAAEAAAPQAAAAPHAAVRQPSDRELSVRQALLLVIGLTALAALVAYISRASCSGSATDPTSTPYLEPPTRPLGTVAP